MAKEKRSRKKKIDAKTPVAKDVTDSATAPGGADDLAAKVDETVEVHTVGEVIEPGVEEYEPLGEYEEVATPAMPRQSTTAAAREAQLAPTVMRRVSRQPADARMKNRRDRIKARRERQKTGRGPRY